MLSPSSAIGPDLQNYSVEEIEQAWAGKTPPEAVRMYLAIMKGGQMGAGDGWFGPGQSRYSWTWLARQCGAEDAESLRANQFPGPAAHFERLDRDRSGLITPDDLDWSDDHPWIRQSYLVNRLFRKMNSTGDGQLSRQQWLDFFDDAAHDRSTLSFSDLRDHWLAGLGAGFLPGDAPTKETLVRGLFAGEVGSLREGPGIGDPAPDFHLSTPDGIRSIRLGDLLGTRPVVLDFGNYTCSPFRSMYAEVDEVARRYQGQASFVGIYVREAHPSDGWKMESNGRVGVEVPQPTTLAGRAEVARQCLLRIKPTIPWLVDTIDDQTGHAYSGMPARLYVIDRAGLVTYKAGRGPFGFKVGEMEQSLIMTLLDQSSF